MKHKLGLIGYPLSHTFSPTYFAEKFSELGIQDAEYLAYSIDDIDKINDVFDKGVTGLNVTIPYKEQVIPYLDELSEEAEAIGAVNTIKIVDGRKVGYNTDVFGFVASLLEQLQDTKVENALILGSGGASKAVKYVLNKIGISSNIVSRKEPFLKYDELDQEIIEDHKLVINTTPLGMYPNVDTCPDIPYEALTNQHFLYDLVYNPEKTLFLKKGESAGSNIKSGNDMLILQAEKSWQIWNEEK